MALGEPPQEGGRTTDVDALLQVGILDRVAGGLIEFPYDAVKVELLLRAA